MLSMGEVFVILVFFPPVFEDPRILGEPARPPGSPEDSEKTQSVQVKPQNLVHRKCYVDPQYACANFQGQSP